MTDEGRKGKVVDDEWDFESSEETRTAPEPEEVDPVTPLVTPPAPKALAREPGAPVGPASSAVSGPRPRLAPNKNVRRRSRMLERMTGDAVDPSEFGKEVTPGSDISEDLARSLRDTRPPPLGQPGFEPAMLIPGATPGQPPGEVTATTPRYDKPRFTPRQVRIAAAVAVAIVAVIVFVLLRGGGGSSSGADAARNAEVTRRLQLADKRLHDGRLTGPGGDFALDHLLAAKDLAPTDPRVLERLSAIADTFEQLAASALAAGDLAEAAAHLQAAINAAPDRQRAIDKLHEVEASVRDRQHPPK